MHVALTTTSKGLLALIAVLALGTQAEAQERAGVVTTLAGDVTVMRASLPEPAPLKFKDDIFVKDRIATGQDSVARILLGGRAVVTVREYSVVTITDVPGRSTIEVAAGRAAVAVARERMQAGDLIEVKTPNAVAGIRGTVIVAEVVDPDHSVITVLKGVIDVRRLGGGRLVGQATVVRALQRVTVAGSAPVSAPQTIAPGAATRLGQEFRVAPPRATPAAVTAAIKDTEVRRAARHLAAISGLRKSDQGESDRDDARHDDDERDALRRDADGNADKAYKARATNGGPGSGKTDGAVAVTANGRAAAGLNSLGETLKSSLGEALKHSERGNGKHKGRDR